MKVIPLSGFKVEKMLQVAVRAFDVQTLSPVDVRHHPAFIEYIKIVNKKDLLKVIASTEDVKNILSKFTNTETFAILEPRYNVFGEFYDLKVTLVLIYIAHRWIVDTGIEESYKSGTGPMFGYHTENRVESTTCNINIGTKNIDENNYTLTVPTYLTEDEEIDSWRIPNYQDNSLLINEDISDILNSFSIFINNNNQMAPKLRSALYLMYTTLNFNDKSLIIILYATILETLLLSNDDMKNKRKNVSVRIACILCNCGYINQKKYIANWVYYFYKYRNAIVHRGNSFIELQTKDSIGIFNHVLALIQHSIYLLIKKIVSNNIGSINEIKYIVDSNVKKDHLKNRYDYINQSDMNLYYDE